MTKSKIISSALSVLVTVGIAGAFGASAFAQNDQPDQNSDQATQPQRAKKKEGPVSIEQIQKDTQRQPASVTGQSTSTKAASDVGETQNAFFEVSPAIGAISIFDKSAFTIGSNFSFAVSRSIPLFFEPSILLSFYSGVNANSTGPVPQDKNATLFHIDGGLRYDWVISGSPIIPFVKAAIGPTLSSTSDVKSSATGDTVSDSYLNQFYGGGVKVLINPKIMARADAGLTFQSTNAGLYFLGSVALPL